MVQFEQYSRLSKGSADITICQSTNKKVAINKKQKLVNYEKIFNTLSESC